uniref:Thioesterase domain-containing protein n=1 Tax=Tetradesmus obliquus TaxID=3088 RepID=A0A383VJE5_TETOB|eukprot:jgi/Sobl393_1/16283/SZX65667.1
MLQVLKEEAETAGAAVPDDPTDEQLEAWTEDKIRQYYANGGNPGAAAAIPPTANGSHPAGKAAGIAAAAMPAEHQQAKQQQQQQQQQHHQQQQRQDISLAEQLSQLSLRFPATGVHSAASRAWFPGLALSKTDVAQPQAVVLCFHSSGNAEDMFTSEGTGSRRAPSPLLELCRAQRWRLLAAQLPGRGLRANEAPLETLQEVAQQLLPLVAPALLAAGGRYALVAHSMGCWAAFELLLLLRQAGFPEPAVACLSAMPWPHIPMHQRPWRQQRLLQEQQFKEECRGWDISDVVFSAGMWGMYQPMLRADFKLFDEYEPSSSSSSSSNGSSSNGSTAPCSSSNSGAGSRMIATACSVHNGPLADSGQRLFSFPLRLFWGTQDRRVTRAMVQEWASYTSSTCTATAVDGNHLFPLQPAAKQQWLTHVAAALSEPLAQ